MTKEQYQQLLITLSDNGCFPCLYYHHPGNKFIVPNKSTPDTLDSTHNVPMRSPAGLLIGTKDYVPEIENYEFITMPEHLQSRFVIPEGMTNHDVWCIQYLHDSLVFQDRWYRQKAFSVWNHQRFVDKLSEILD